MEDDRGDAAERDPDRTRDSVRADGEERGAGSARLGQQDLVGPPFEEPAGCAGSLRSAAPNAHSASALSPEAADTAVQPACTARASVEHADDRQRSAVALKRVGLPDGFEALGQTRRRRRATRRNSASLRVGADRLGVARSCSSVHDQDVAVRPVRDAVADGTEQDALEEVLVPVSDHDQVCA